ncbi:uncharacterized protein [Amphiura filiformis]|uniref:uncharacterized protein n=1 Tax=Amphiura filiformis TaxID=82378 RepID=UPI003B223053
MSDPNRYHGDGYQTREYDSGQALCAAAKRGDVKLKIGDRLKMEMLKDTTFTSMLYSHWGVVSNVPECVFLGFSPGIVPNPSSSGSTSSRSSSSNPFQSLNSFSSSSHRPNSSNKPFRYISALYSLEELKIAEFPKKIKVDNSDDSFTKPLPETEIRKKIDGVMAVPDLMGPFDVVSNNCEHFVNCIRYGKKESRQVQATAAVAATGATVGAALAMCVII